MADTADKPDKNWTLLFVAWLIATGSCLGSLFFSEIMDLAPCSLCWYQRIFMFPLPILLLVGLFPFDPKVVRYALPIVGVGAGFAIYHTLLYVGIIPESAAPCQQGVSCKERYIELLGFLSIPMLSALSFLSIAGLLLVLRKRLSS